MLVALLWVELSLQATVRVALNLQVWDDVQWLPCDVVLLPAGSGACRNPPLGVLIVWLVGSSFLVG